jgi:putative FmdB family regulatory protein
MPTYRYECRSCKKIHEFFQSMSEKPVRKCPSCGGRLDRLIGTGAGIILKGSGFHNTDYRSESYREAAKSETAKSESSASAGEKSESKSASDSTSKKDAPAKSETQAKPKPAKKKAKDD